MAYQTINLGIKLGSNYLTEISAYFLGGIFAASESVNRNGKTYWISPYRYNSRYASNTEIESHFNSISYLVSRTEGHIYMAETIRNNHLDSGKFDRMPGFGVFFESDNCNSIEDKIPALHMALNNSSSKVKTAFVLGMFDGRGSIDINKSTNVVRYIVLDCVNNVIGNFLNDVINDMGFETNYNTARDRLLGGEPRKPQLRIKGNNRFIEKVGFISPKKFDVAFDQNYVDGGYSKVDGEILKGQKIARR